MQYSDNIHLFVDDNGLNSWEEVDVVRSGANYGYSRIEGNMVLGEVGDQRERPLDVELALAWV